MFRGIDKVVLGLIYGCLGLLKTAVRTLLQQQEKMRRMCRRKRMKKSVGISVTSPRLVGVFRNVSKVKEGFF